MHFHKTKLINSKNKTELFGAHFVLNNTLSSRNKYQNYYYRKYLVETLNLKFLI